MFPVSAHPAQVATLRFVQIAHERALAVARRRGFDPDETASRVVEEALRTRARWDLSAATSVEAVEMTIITRAIQHATDPREARRTDAADRAESASPDEEHDEDGFARGLGATVDADPFAARDAWRLIEPALAHLTPTNALCVVALYTPLRLTTAHVQRAADAPRRGRIPARPPDDTVRAVHDTAALPPEERPAAVAAALCLAEGEADQLAVHVRNVERMARAGLEGLRAALRAEGA